MARQRHLRSSPQGLLSPDGVPLKPGMLPTAPSGVPAAGEVGNILYEPTTGVYVANADAWVLIGQYPDSGLTLIANQSFSAAASVSVDSVFTSTYRDYRVVLDITDTSALADIQARLRAGGADDSTGYYGHTKYALATVDNVNYRSALTTNGAQWMVSDYGVDPTMNRGFVVMDLSSPQVSGQLTLAAWKATVWGSTTFVAGEDGAGSTNDATQFDGIKFLGASGTFSGTLKIYGYQNTPGSVGGGVAPYTDEMARDAIGTALVAGTNITITVDDALNTITINSTASGSSSSLSDILMLGGM